MTIPDFVQRWGGDYQIFLKSDLGKALFETLEELRMPPECHPQEHQAIYRLGGVAGYEQCLYNMKRLATTNLKVAQPEPNYGIKKNSTEAKETSNS